MLKKLATVANRLNSLGLFKETNEIDQVIKKHSMMHGGDYLKCDNMIDGMICNRIYSEHRNSRYEGKDLCPPCARELADKISRDIRDSDLGDLG